MWVCAGVCGCVQVCAGVCGCVRVWVGVRMGVWKDKEEVELLKNEERERVFCVCMWCIKECGCVCIYVCVSVDTLLCAREIKKVSEQKIYW